MITRLILLTLLATFTASAHADNTGWSFHIDNDLFLGGDRDQDYTGGLSFTLSGERAKNYWWSGQHVRRLIDRLVGFNKLTTDEVAFSLHSADFGFALFTPSDITLREVQPNERPYGSLFFVGSTLQTIVPAKRLSYQANLLIGALGLPLADDVQSSIHNATGSNTPKGWDNQISEGGELTARYALAVTKGLVHYTFGSSIGVELNATVEANLGFNTDVNTGLYFRLGRLSTPWWTFAPHQAEYVNLGNPSVSIEGDQRRREFYVYAGATAKYRLYNALLQGQFRDSIISYDADEIEPKLIELYSGISYELPSGLRVGIFGRALSAELDIPNASEPRWGGFTLSQGF